MQSSWELRFNTYNFYKFEVEPEHIHASTDEFGLMLSIPLKISSPIDINLPDKFISLIGGNIKLSMDTTYPSSFNIPAQPLLLNTPINIPVTKEQIKKIEKHRKYKENVVLYCSLFAQCFIPGDYEFKTGGYIPIEELNRSRGQIITLQSNISRISIDREHWSKLLENMGFDSYRLIEIPTLSLKNKQKERLHYLIKDFEQICHSERIADYQTCLVNSRLLVETMITMMASHLQIDLSGKKTAGKKLDSLYDQANDNYPQEKVHIESLTKLLASIIELSNSYHHSETDCRIKTAKLLGNTNEQCQYILQLCSAAVTACCQVLSYEPPLPPQS